MGRTADAMTWIRAQGLHLLGAAIGLFIACGLLAYVQFLMPTEWAALRVLRAVLGTAALLALFGGLAVAGVWLANLTDATWRQRMLLRAMDDAYRSKQMARERLDALRQLGQGDHPASDILARGRRLTWTGAAVGLPGVFATIVALGTFGETEETLAFALPIVLPITLVAAAVFLRGVQVVGDARRLVRSIDPRPSKAAKRAART